MTEMCQNIVAVKHLRGHDQLITFKGLWSKSAMFGAVDLNAAAFGAVWFVR